MATVGEKKKANRIAEVKNIITLANKSINGIL
jgi:hypothetical protein